MTKKQSRQGSISPKVNIIVIAVILFLITVIAFLLLKPIEEKTIKIGCLLTLSQSGASMGKDIMDGLSFATDEINSWGGINGKKIELIVEDTHSNPDVAKKMFKKIESEYHPDLYISNMSSVALGVAPLAEKFQVPLVALITSTAKLTKQSNWAFRYWSSAQTEANALISIIQRLKVKSIGILSTSDEYGVSILELVLKELEKTEIKILKKEFAPNNKQFAALINEMAQMESILLIGYPPHVTITANQIRKIGYKGKSIYTNCASHPDVRIAAKLEGAYVPAPLIYKKDFIFARQANDKFIKQYKRTLNHFSANGYDFIKLLSYVMAAQDISRTQVRNNLEEGFIYSGVYGEVRVKNNERDMSFDYYPARIVNGQVEFLE